MSVRFREVISDTPGTGFIVGDVSPSEVIQHRMIVVNVVVNVVGGDDDRYHTPTLIYVVRSDEKEDGG